MHRISHFYTFSYVKYGVISREPEDDAIRYIKDWAVKNGIDQPQIIGWDFPHVSQEQINLYHMHGYAVACILPLDFNSTCKELEIITQSQERYAVITIKEPFIAPFTLIPNAYKTLMIYMEVNGYKHKHTKEVL